MAHENSPVSVEASTLKAKKAVILARGLGTRMRAADASAPLARDQALAADSGVKAMIPVGRPFLDYVLSALADAGFTEVCLVVGPEHDAMRDYYRHEAGISRIALGFAVQERPLGTADAVLAAEEFAAGELFVVLNSDNYYPAASLRELSLAGEPAVVGFARSALMRDGNVTADRLDRFGAVEVDAHGYLKTIVGEPDAAAASTGGKIYASMNCWLFDDAIFQACREVAPSARGELELPQAVRHGIDRLGMRFRVILSGEGVLDLSSRADIPSVATRLAGIEIRI